MRNAAEATVLVTGATDGLGRRVAQELAARGATVLLHGRNPERLEAALEELGNDTDGKKLAPAWRTSPRSARCERWQSESYRSTTASTCS